MSALAAPLLSASGLVAGYEPGLPILDHASLAVRAAEILAVLGPNGAGKSTVIKALGGLVPISAGTVRMDGTDITHLPAHRRLRHGLAFVPQTENVFAGMSVADNLRLAADRRAERKGAGARIAALFESFPDLARQRHLLAGRLSGGQRQMLAIARALILDPRVLLLDEPSAGLSPRLVEEVFGHLRTVRASGVAIVLVEQNVRAALAIADRVLVLAQGRNRHEGPAAPLAEGDTLARLFLEGAHHAAGAA